MKKILRVAIGVVLCLLLTACGGSNEAALESDIIVHMEVNPSFDIHVNNDGTIKSVECLNEDAQSVYAEMDLTGVAYEDGFKQLLMAIKEGGFLQQGDIIEISVRKAPKVTLEVEDKLNQIVSEFSTHETPVEVEINSVVVDASKFPKSEEMAERKSSYVMNINKNSEPSAYVLVYLDEQQVVTYVLGRDSLGEQIAEKANAVGMPVKQGCMAIWDAGYTLGVFVGDDDVVWMGLQKTNGSYDLVAQVTAWFEEWCRETGNYFVSSFNPPKKYTGEWTTCYKDGKDRWWVDVYTYEDGVRVSKVGTASDGSKTEVRFDADEVESYSSIMDMSAGLYEEMFFENGKAIKEVFTNADGSHTEITFYGNGNTKHEITDGADGVHTEIDYYENGNPKTRIEDGGEGHFEIYYNIDGEIERQILNYADGRYSEYYEDGSFKHGFPDGSWVLFDADGNVIDESN